MKMKHVLMMSIFLSIFVDNAYAPDTEKFKVCVIVEYEKEDRTEGQIIESHLKKELRALGDVIIVNEKADWQFRVWIATLGLEYKDGTRHASISIASALQLRIPKNEFRFYRYTHPHIPIYAFTPAPSYYLRDNLSEWCVSEANMIDKQLESFRNLSDFEKQQELYYP